MIRPVTLLSFAAFIGSGLYLYQVKHQAQMVDRQIRSVREATEATVERAKLLRSEYELLNNPDRLAELAAEYVPDLKPTQPSQWSSMAEIARRLPPVGAPTTQPAPVEPPVPMLSPAHPEPLVATRTEPAPPSHPPSRPAAAIPASAAAVQPVTVVAIAPEPAALRAPPLVSRAVAPVARPMPRPAVVAPPAARALTPIAAERPAVPNRAASPYAAPIRLSASPLPIQRPAPSLPVAAPAAPAASAGTSVLAIAARGPAAPAMAAPLIAPSPPARQLPRESSGQPPVPMVASALGMARTMMAVAPANGAIGDQPGAVK